MTKRNQFQKQQENIYFSKAAHKISNKILDTHNFCENVDNKTVLSTNGSSLNFTIPSSVNNMGVKGINHFFRAKVKKLQQDVDQLQNEISKKVPDLMLLISNKIIN